MRRGEPLPARGWAPTADAFLPLQSRSQEAQILVKYNSAGTSYVEVDDSGGTPRDISPYADYIDFCGRDFYDPTVSVKQIVIQGPWDDKASTGSDVVLAGILGTVVTVSFGPAGNGSGARKITGIGHFLTIASKPGRRAG